ncbi:MAG: hypothetical protein WBF48_04525, partial [Halarcobacter sp.]
IRVNMYIHHTYSISNEKQNTNENIKVYKSLLKEISKINLRRSSKFNILAVLGALKCMKEKTYSDNMGIYLASEYGSITSVKNVLEQVSQDSIVMPFDFLNINSNNVSFYVSQALESKGKNMVLTSHDLSFEKALELALFDLEIDEVKDALIGNVDESLDGINNFNKYISNVEKKPSKDLSAWIYINKQKDDSLAKIETFSAFTNINELNELLKNTSFELAVLNQYATKQINDLQINKDLVFSHDNVHGSVNIISMLNSDKKSFIYLAMDINNKGYLVKFTK